MGSGKDETLMPRSVAQPETFSGKTKDVPYRLQVEEKENYVHAHEDATDPHRVFIWKGIRGFALQWQDFAARRGLLEPGEIAAFIGETADPGGGRVAGVLVWERLPSGIFETRIDEYDPETIYDMEIRKDPAIEFVDDWVQRKC